MGTPHVVATGTPRTHDLSRRAALRLIGAGGLGVGFAARGVSAAQDQDVPDVVRDWIDAWNDNDPDAIAALYADDGRYEDVPSGLTARGDEIADFLREFFAGVSDVRLDLDNAFGGDDWAVAEYTFSATNQRFFPEAPVGAAWSVRTATVFELDGDEIRRSSDYYDVATVLNQIGVAPPAGAATPPAGPMATPVA